MFGGKKRKQRLEQAGVDAPAVVVALRDTGMTINDNPRVVMTLEVSRPDGGTFQVEHKTTVSRVQIPRPGDRFGVRYVPEDPDNFEILGMLPGGEGAFSVDSASAGDIAAAVQAGAGGAKQGSAAELLASGQRMQGVLTEFADSGQTVGDQNPALPDPTDPIYILKLDLVIEGTNPIESVFMTRVPASEIAGLRLGRKFEVAVNPSNPSREVAVDWAASAALG